jgi:hypothetical protein
MLILIAPLLLVLSVVAGCVVVDDRKPNGPVMKTGGGPPPWAPAHGRRAKEAAAYTYYYYPSAGVYFSVATGSYFYSIGSSWQVTTSLPSTIVVNSGDYVTLQLATDKPYLYYDEHKMKYKMKGNNGRGKGNKHW